MNGGHIIKLGSCLAVVAAGALFGVFGHGKAPEPVPWSDDVVVISSTSPDHKVGTIFSANDEVEIANGAAVEVVTEHGHVARFEGPFQGYFVVQGPTITQSREVGLWRALVGRGKSSEVVAASR